VSEPPISPLHCHCCGTAGTSAGATAAIAAATSIACTQHCYCLLHLGQMMGHCLGASGGPSGTARA